MVEQDVLISILKILQKYSEQKGLKPSASQETAVSTNNLMILLKKKITNLMRREKTASSLPARPTKYLCNRKKTN